MRGDYRFACYYFITYLIILRKYVGFLLIFQYLCTLKKENGHKERPNGNNSNTASALP
jgi:hypothetical protein